MPVLVLGAASGVGRHLAKLLLDEDAQVRAYVTGDDAELRSAGCKVAVGELDDIGRIESAMEQVHTVVHVAPVLIPPDGRTLEWMIEETTDVAIRAAVSADVRRFLMVSHVGASTDAQEDVLAAYGRAGALVQKAGIEHAVFLCAPIADAATPFGAHLREARRARVPVAPGDGSQRLNPIAAGDVARALLLADSREASVAGVWELGGPAVVSYDEAVRYATGATRVAHRRSVPGLPKALAHVYARDCVADSSRLLESFPISLTEPHETLRL